LAALATASMSSDLVIEFLLVRVAASRFAHRLRPQEVGPPEERSNTIEVTQMTCVQLLMSLHMQVTLTSPIDRQGQFEPAETHGAVTGVSHG